MIKKKSWEDANKKREVENDMEQLNKAAFEALKKDLINDPSLAAKYGISLTKEKESSKIKVPKESNKVEIKKEALVEDTKQQLRIEKDLMASTCASRSSNVSATDWYEAVSDEGYHYFWNTKTNESVWEKPEHYISLEEQDQLDTANDTPDTSNRKEDVKIKSESEEIKKEGDVQSDAVIEGPLPRDESDNRTRVETCTSRKAYGDWVTYEEEAAVDYELPDVETKEIPLPEFSAEEPVKVKFKEKRVTTLSHSGDATKVAFKKRKITKGALNVRSRDSLDN